MDTQEVVKIIDNLVFSQTGKHLDTLQLGILKGVFNSQKYAKIAEDYNCAESHARDKAYELWRILSEALGEKLNKSNVRSAIERFIITNSINNLGNKSVKINKINFCYNSTKSTENLEIDDTDIIEKEDCLIEEKLKQSIPKLIQMGLTAEQIAQALDLELQLVVDNLK